jgi:two-component system osmolarity sensor histidine kinase EnvZ
MKHISRFSAWRFDSVGARAAVGLISLLAVTQAVTLALYYFLVMEPQARRLATLLAQSVSSIAETMERLPAREQEAFLERLSRSPYLRVYPDLKTWPVDADTPTWLESVFLKMLAANLSEKSAFEWRRGEDGRLWLAMTLAGKRYWMSTRPPDQWRPEWAFGLTAASSLVISIAAGLFLQRRFGRSFRALSAAARRVSLSSSAEVVPVQGPREVIELGRSFNRMTERLASAERERNFMLAGISHDLRTPLAKIRLAVEMLDPGRVTDDLRETIVRQIEAMDAMLAQFLDFARGVDQEAFEQVLPSKIVSDVVEAAGNPHVTAAPIDGAPVPGKPVALHRAASNLVSNAIKYGQPPILVENRYDGDSCVISVRDHGPGLSAADRERLTQPFVRGDSARGGPGSGLGLAIVARVAQSHGGRLMLENADGGGLRALLVLPMSGLFDGPGSA